MRFLLFLLAIFSHSLNGSIVKADRFEEIEAMLKQAEKEDLIILDVD